MSKYTNQLSAKDLIKYIANDYVELSQEKVLLMYHEHMRICAEWLAHNTEEEEKPSNLKDDF